MGICDCSLIDIINDAFLGFSFGGTAGSTGGGLNFGTPTTQSAGGSGSLQLGKPATSTTAGFGFGGATTGTAVGTGAAPSGKLFSSVLVSFNFTISS